MGGTLAGSDDAFMQQQRQPATGADGSLYMTGMGGENGWSLYRVDPDTGDVLWHHSPWPSNGMSPPTVGPDGSVYYSRSLSYMDSLTADGQSRWTFFDGTIIDHPGVSPDGSIVVAGDRPNFGQPGSARGWNASTGALSWQVNLPNENGGYQVVETQPRFSADSSTAYFGTAVLGGGTPDYSFLYAVDTGVAPPPPPPPPRRRLRLLLPRRRHHLRLRLRLRPHHLPRLSSAAAATGSSTAGALHGPQVDRDDGWPGPHADPQLALLSRPNPPPSLDTRRPRNQAEPKAGNNQAPGVPGRSR